MKTLLPIACACLVACARTPGSSPEEDVASTSEALSPFQWTTDAKAGDNLSVKGGSVALHHGKIHLVHQGENGSPDLWWSTFDGTKWTDDKQLSNVSGTRPTLVDFNGKLYMFHTGKASNQVFMARFDDVNGWSGSAPLSLTSNTSPGATFDAAGYLHVVGSTPGTNQLWEATMSSTEMFSTSSVLAAQSKTSPSLTTVGVVFDGEIVCMTFLEAESQRVMFATYNGRGWNAPTPVPSAVPGTPLRSSFPPGIGSADATVHLVFDDATATGQIEWTYSPYPFTSWATPVGLPGQFLAVSGPAMTSALTFEDLFMVHPGKTDHNIWYSTFKH